MSSHEPECIAPWQRECICKELRGAYRRGYNDHAKSVAYWEATHGKYPSGEVTGEVTVKYNLEYDSGSFKVNQHGKGENP